MAARKQLWHPDIVRKRIQASQIVNRLREHALGNVEMTATQIRAAEILLKKAVPDLSSVNHTGELIHRHASELTEAQLERIAAGGSAGTTAETQSPPEPSSVH